MAIVKSSNGPTLIKNQGVFPLNSFTLSVDFASEVVIEAPVTAVVLDGGVPQPSIVVAPVISGANVSATITPEQMTGLSKKDASLNILFNGEYVVQTPLAKTFKGSEPGAVTSSYESPSLGVFRVSFYHGATQAALTEADRIACEAARDYIDDAMTAVNDRVPGFLDSFADVILAGHDAAYTTVFGALTDSDGVNGGTIDEPNETIEIGTGTSGQNSYMRMDFDMSSTENLRENDLINVRCVISQDVDGAISGSVVGLRLFTSDGVAVPFSTVGPTLYDAETKTFTLDGQFTVANILTTYYIEVYIKAGAPNQSADVEIRWLDVGINQDKYLYEDAIDLVNQSVQGYPSLARVIADGPIITDIDMSGTTDVTAAWQAEINAAATSSGKWLGRPGTPKITSSLLLGSQVEIDLGGMDVNVAIPTPTAPTAGSEAFTIFTASPVNIKNGKVRRHASNPTYSPTFCRFSASFVNVNSVFERLELINMPHTMYVDYCTDLTIQDCNFGGGQFEGLRAGFTAPQFLTGLKIRRCKFLNYLSSSVQVASIGGFVFEENEVYSTSASTFTNRGLDLAPAAGSAANKTVRIRRNKFYNFREYGLSLIVAAGQVTSDIMVLYNVFDDRTPDATDASSRPIHVAGNAKNISAMTVALNHIWTKEIGIWADNATVFKAQNNSIFKSNVGGAYAASQGILGSNLDYALGGNIIDPALAVATVPGSWASSSAYTTI